MSSFVIDKIEYVKAAGLMYGIESVKTNKHVLFMNCVYDKFCWCYNINVESVSEQYDEDQSYDNNKYLDVFKEYAKKGAGIFYGVNPKIRMPMLKICLMKFFNSVLYQIENEEMNQSVKAFFYTCVSKLFTETDKVEGWWGEVEL